MNQSKKTKMKDNLENGKPYVSAERTLAEAELELLRCLIDSEQAACERLKRTVELVGPFQGAFIVQEISRRKAFLEEILMNQKQLSLS